MRVKVRELGSVPDELRGLDGTITQSFGHPEHAAHDVLLDGVDYPKLFWHYQLVDEPQEPAQGALAAPCSLACPQEEVYELREPLTQI